MQSITFEDRLKRAFKKHPVTMTILLINTVMVILLMAFSSSIFSFDTTTLVNFGALVPSLITNQHAYYRLITAMFLHGSIIHFLMNSYFLYIIGGFVEDLFGKTKYIIIYFISGLGSSLLIWLTQMDSTTATIGASGALFGIMGALLVLTYKKPSLFSPYGIRSIRTLVVINIFFTFIGFNISIFGHIGGFFTGIILMYLLSPKTIGPNHTSPPHNEHTHHGNYVIDADDVSDDDIYYKN
ncbi:MAG: rhomboid family intramembrane serine protease [Acholeplasmataceae bacterium]